MKSFRDIYPHGKDGSTLCASILGPSGYLLKLGITEFNSAYGSQDIWIYAFNKVGAATLITGLSGIGVSGKVSMILLANTPQLLLSITYFMYNALLTRMLIAAEYDNYAFRRKYLRVSWPQGSQRSTYYLSLPYRYSIPFLSSSAILHWFVSQSIFFVEIIPYDLNGIERGYDVVCCGYSPVAIIFAIALGSVLASTAVLLGFRRFKSRMPLAIECSVAISAMCHPLSGNDHALGPVKWGELFGRSICDEIDLSASTANLELCGNQPIVECHAKGQIPSNTHTERPATSESSFFHCSFTSEDVSDPSISRLYI
ncbi:unnamed protein product [Penicillium pancosmium]